VPRSRALSRALSPALLLAALAGAPAHAGLPTVSVSDARVVEGTGAPTSLQFEVTANGPPRRLAIPYSLTDLTASAASGDYLPAGGVVSLTPEPARLIAHWGAGRFYIPGGLALAPDGVLIAVDRPSARIHRFSSAGVLLQTIESQVGAPLVDPRGVAANHFGEFYVVDISGHINMYSAAGKCVDNWTMSGTDMAYGVAVDAQGIVYVGDVTANRIQKFGRLGGGAGGFSTHTPGEPANDAPLGIAVDAQGFVYVAKAQSGRILKFAPDGTLVATWTDTRGFCPGGDLDVDAGGNLLIADLHTSRVVVLDPTGSFLCDWTLDNGPVQNPTEFSTTGIASDASGNVYVASRHSATVALYRWDRASASISVPVTGDATFEPDETLRLELARTPNATLVDSIAVGTIVNDDPQVGPNLVTNGQFESGLGGWSAYAGATLQVVASGVGGTNAARAVGSGSLSFGLNDGPNIVTSTTAGDRYRYSVWVRSTATGSARLRVREYLAGVQQANTGSLPVTFDGSWQRLDVAVRAQTTGGFLDFQIIGDFAATGGEFFIDDVAVQALGPDVPPVVQVNTDLNASWAHEVVVEVSALDPEGDPIDSLQANLAGLPGATFSFSSDHTHGTLRWHPGFEDIRDDPYVVLFSARNAVTGTASTKIHVGPNMVLNPSFATDLDGWNGHAGAALARVPGGRLDGYSARLTLPVAEWAGLGDSPNWAASSGNGRVAVCAAWVRSMTNGGAIRLQVREYQAGLQIAESTSGTGPLYSSELTPDWHRIMVVHRCVATGPAELDLAIDAPGVTGATFDVDDVSVTGCSGAWTLDAPTTTPPITLAAHVFPNPVRGPAMLELSLPAAGRLQIELYDLAGRRRAVIADEARAEAGIRRFALHAPDGPLVPGIYWYRASTASGSRSGRFVVVE